jgi:hypothetical protein
MTRTLLPARPDGSRVIELRADELVPGLFITHEKPAGDGELIEVEPLKIVAIEPYGDGRLLFTFDADTLPGCRQVPFPPDELLAMWCPPIVCPAWCVECDDAGNDGSVHHGGEIRRTPADPAGQVMSVSTYRFDDPDGEQEPAAISVVFGKVMHGDDIDDMTPATARALGQLLVRAADDIEPERVADVQDVRLGDELATPAGWQTVTGVMHDAQCREVALYTISDEDPAGRYGLDDQVTIRRPGARASRKADAR